MSDYKFEFGDYVRWTEDLDSPTMMVEDVTKGKDELNIVKCMWFDKNNNVQRSWFPEDFLTFRPKFDKSIYPKRCEFLAKQEEEQGA